MLTLWI